MVNATHFESFANSVINSLLDRLEAAEKEHDALRGRIEAAEELVRELQRNLSSGMWRVLREENEALSAKVDAMEKQEPVAWMSSRNGFIVKDNKNPDYNMPLYLAPGAKGMK